MYTQVEGLQVIGYSIIIPDIVLITQVEGLLQERGPIFVSGLGDFGRLIVADVRVEGGDQHQRLAHQLGDVLPDHHPHH